jgi:hypothetical protein
MTAQHLRPKAGKRLKAVQSKVSPSRFNRLRHVSLFKRLNKSVDANPSRTLFFQQIGGKLLPNDKA